MGRSFLDRGFPAEICLARTPTWSEDYTSLADASRNKEAGDASGARDLLRHDNASPAETFGITTNDNGTRGVGTDHIEESFFNEWEESEDEDPFGAIRLS